ncbi:MAG TPA: hypothetical protein DDZ55_08220 [Firmicutes bacterium]|nr:hypothetical protein [Bacillota bacterium]
MIHRACVLPPNQFEREYKRVIAEAKRAGFKELCADQWARRKAYLDANGGKAACGIPADYPYAEFLDEFK